MSISNITSFLANRAMKAAVGLKKERGEEFPAQGTERRGPQAPSSRMRESAAAPQGPNNAYRVTISPAALAKMEMAAGHTAPV